MSTPSKTRNRRGVIILASALVFVLVAFAAPVVPETPQIRRTLATGVLMAILWISEAIPLAATALLPLALFPLFGVMKGEDVASRYLNSTIFLFVGGFIIALAMEKWNLHRRIALRVILAVGSSPARLLMGVMLSTWLISMWLSNTATAMMMLPIVIALFAKIDEAAPEGARKLEVALLLGLAYSASIGGMATLVGTPPNLAFARIYAISFPAEPEVTFLGWLAIGLPVSILMFLAAFSYLYFLFARGPRVEIDPEILREEYRGLGKASYEERVVSVAFAVLAILLITRSDITINERVVHGWASAFGDPSYLDDGTVAIAVALALFFIPARGQDEFIMDRGTVRKLPWNVIVLLGGGFALAEGFQRSGLSMYIGGYLRALQGMHPLLIMAGVCTLMTFLTELTSNTAITQVVLPIVASVSQAVGIPPLYLMAPAAISASCAFMLPVATPPNAIIFGTQRIRVSEMASVGLWLNLIGVVIVSLAVYLLGRVLM